MQFFHTVARFMFLLAMHRGLDSPLAPPYLLCRCGDSPACHIGGGGTPTVLEVVLAL